jgi:PAS domain S-box-containing protein
MQWVALGIAVVMAALLVTERVVGRRALQETRQLFEAAPVPMVLVDSEGNVCPNRRAAAVWGRPAGELENLGDFLSPESAALAQRHYRRVLEVGKRVEVADVAVAGKDGVVVPCDIVSTPTTWHGRPAAVSLFFPVDQKLAARDALLKSEERFRQFFTEVPVPMYRTRLDGTIVHANPALVTLLGLESEEAAVGANASDFYVNPEQRRAGPVADPLAVDDRVLQLRTASGEHVQVRDLNHVVADQEDPAFEGVIIDVTKEQRYLRELERRAQQQQALAEIARSGLRHADAGHVQDEAVRLVAAVMGADCAMIAQEHESVGLLPTALAFEVDSVREREILREYLEAHLGEGADADVPTSLEPETRLDGPPLCGMQAILSGLDERFGLSAVAATLGSAIARSRSRDRLNRLIRSKDEFVASVSHELRTPLTVVAGLALELQERWHGFSESEIVEFITLIADESKEMGDLIEDLLVAARADIGKVPIYVEDVDLRGCVDQVVAACPLGDRTRVKVVGDVVVGRVDAVRCRQIIRNLLTNAIRYGGPRIEITVGEDRGKARVAVFDDGAGIAEADREKIFVAYERAHDSRAVPGSVGLGLTVSRKLTELMDGSISYRYEGGSYFELEFPLALSSVIAD